MFSFPFGKERFPADNVEEQTLQPTKMIIQMIDLAKTGVVQSVSQDMYLGVPTSNLLVEAKFVRYVSFSVMIQTPFDLDPLLYRTRKIIKIIKITINKINPPTTPPIKGVVHTNTGSFVTTVSITPNSLPSPIG